MTSCQVEVDRLVSECYAALRSPKCLTRRGYHDALALADAALELATDAGLGDGLVRQCEILQDFCQNSLTSAYAKSDRREREAYERAMATTRRSDSDASDTDDGAAL